MASRDLASPRGVPGGERLLRLQPAAVLSRAEALPEQTVLVALVVFQWLLVGILAFRAGHHGWTYDPSLHARALPAIVLAQALLLLPLLVVLVYALALRLAGRAFAAWAALVWVLLPYVGVLYANRGFRTTYVRSFLVHLAGLTPDPALPALAAFAGAVLLALHTDRWGARAAAGAAVLSVAGAAFAPRAALVVAAPILALLLGRRPRQAGAVAAGVALLLALASATGRFDGGVAVFSLPTALDSLAGLKEIFWSGRVLEWATIGGVLALLRGRRDAGAAIALASLLGWLSVKGSYTHAQEWGVALFAAALPVWFAVSLGVAALPLLLPGAGDVPAREPAADTLRRWWTRLQEPAWPRARPAEDAERPIAMPLWTALALGACFAVILFVGVWNASRYPIMLGYDAVDHIGYTTALLQLHALPTGGESGAFYTPPGYYVVAAAAVWIGGHLGLAEPNHPWAVFRLARALNIPFVLATAGLLLVLARMLFPRRPWLWVSTVGFFSLLPIVAKMEAMVHPETFNMLVSTAAVTVAVRILLRREFSLRWLALLGVLLGLGQLIRQSSLFTLVAIGLPFLAALAMSAVRRPSVLLKVGGAVAALALLVTPWYVRQAQKYHRNPLYVNSTLMSHLFRPYAYSWGKRPPFLGFPVRDVVLRPVRPFFLNQAPAETYTDLWGDWSGHFAWSGYSAGPSTAELQVLENQSKIGLLPTALAIAGWFGLLVAAVARRRRLLALLPVLLIPPIALASYAWRAYLEPEPTGNLLGARFILITAPFWALAFGYAVDLVCRRRPIVTAGLVTLFLVGAAIDLQFLLYGVREHHLPFSF